MAHTVLCNRSTSRVKLSERYRDVNPEERRWACRHPLQSDQAALLRHSPTPKTPSCGGSDLPCVPQTFPFTSVLRLERCFRFRSNLCFPSLINSPRWDQPELQTAGCAVTQAAAGPLFSSLSIGELETVAMLWQRPLLDRSLTDTDEKRCH